MLVESASPDLRNKSTLIPNAETNGYNKINVISLGEFKIDRAERKNNKELLI